MLFAADNLDPNDLANYCAKMSCPKWNRSVWEPKTKLGKLYKGKIIDFFYEMSRLFYRQKYWMMAQTAWEAGERQYWINMLGEHGKCANTYPWPYCDRNFANWEVEPNTEVLDPSGNVIKDSTSYCAWKLYELTGEWLNKKLKIHVGAKNWQYFLERAGYHEFVERPEPGHHFIAIDPHDTPKGMVFWFEMMGASGNVIVSTYRARCHDVEVIKAKRVPYYIWMRID